MNEIARFQRFSRVSSVRRPRPRRRRRRARRPLVRSVRRARARPRTACATRSSRSGGKTQSSSGNATSSALDAGRAPRCGRARDLAAARSRDDIEVAVVAQHRLEPVVLVLVDERARESRGASGASSDCEQPLELARRGRRLRRRGRRKEAAQVGHAPYANRPCPSSPFSSPSTTALASSAQAVESVLRPDRRDLELIVVDDASTDETPELLAAVGDPRLVVLRNEEQAGLAASLNRGLDAGERPLRRPAGRRRRCRPRAARAPAGADAGRAGARGRRGGVLGTSMPRGSRAACTSCHAGRARCAGTRCSARPSSIRPSSSTASCSSATASLRPGVPRERGLRPVDAGVRVRGGRQPARAARRQARPSGPGFAATRRTAAVVPASDRAARDRADRAATCLLQKAELAWRLATAQTIPDGSRKRGGAERSSLCSPHSRLGTVARAACAQLQRKRSDAQRCSARWRSSARSLAGSSCAAVDVSRRASSDGPRTASRSE